MKLASSKIQGVSGIVGLAELINKGIGGAPLDVSVIHPARHLTETSTSFVLARSLSLFFLPSLASPSFLSSTLHSLKYLYYILFI